LHVRRTLLASVLPAIAITATWLSLERAPHVRDGVVVAALALLPALVPPGARRLVACLGATVAAAWFTFGAQPWELLPFRDERVLGPALQDAANGIVDFYAVFLPFEPTRSPEMHSLVLCAIFGFVLATALLVAARRPLAAAAVTVAAIGWPATLLGGRAVAIGALALAAALAIPLLLRAASGRAVLVGGLVAALVVVGAAGTSSATTLGTDAALDWETWDIRGGEQSQASSVRVIWDSNYEGITFPARKTVVLRIDGPTSANYWRATTLDQFVDDRWLENLFWLEQVDHGDRLLQLPQLVPQRAQRPDRWLEQRVEVEALVDDHLVAAGTPIALDARRLGTVFLLSGGVLRADRPVAEGRSYRIWSYSPDPAPRALAQAPIRFPPATARFREVDGRLFPAFGTDGRERVVRDLFADPSYAGFTRHRRMYDIAQRVAGQADTPYGAVLALESWFRQTGGFTYDESPPRVGGPPLLAFVTRTRAGYCQHFAGAMAGMLRMLGIPARVAVGFTSGSPDDGEWVVTDHDAHAWVEVWFAGIGWVAFDPTPGRGTLGGEYTFASGSEAAVAALRRGELRRSTLERTPRPPDAGDLPGDVGSSDASAAPSLVGIGLVLAAAWVLLLGLGKAAMRRARYLSRDPRQLATASRRELEDFLRDQGADVPQTATLATLQRAVNEELGLDARQFATAAARARFGPPAMGATEASRARDEARRIIRAARSELSVWARARGLVSLRSLRTAAGP
jgi:transglutaminase-like putative cysteine protease